MKAARSLWFFMSKKTLEEGALSLELPLLIARANFKGKTIADAVLSLDYENSNVACLIDQGCGVCMMARGIISTVPNIVNYLGIDVKDAEKDVEELARPLPGVFATFKQQDLLAVRHAEEKTVFMVQNAGPAYLSAGILIDVSDSEDPIALQVAVLDRAFGLAKWVACKMQRIDERFLPVIQKFISSGYNVKLLRSGATRITSREICIIFSWPLVPFDTGFTLKQFTNDISQASFASEVATHTAAGALGACRNPGYMRPIKLAASAGDVGTNSTGLGVIVSGVAAVNTMRSFTITGKLLSFPLLTTSTLLRSANLSTATLDPGIKNILTAYLKFLKTVCQERLLLI